MDDIAPVLGVAGVVAFIAGIIAIVWYFDKKRREAFQAWGATNNLPYVADTSGVMRELFEFQLFNKGHSRTVKNLLRGPRENGQVLLCDYQYSTGSGKSRTTYSQTVCVLSTPGRGGEPFFIRRQRALFDSIGKLFGGQDINFEDDAEFSKAWVLQGPDEQGVRRFFTPRLRAWFTENAGKSLVVESRGDTLLVHLGRSVKPTELGDLLALNVNLRRHWP